MGARAGATPGGSARTSASRSPCHDHRVNARCPANSGGADATANSRLDDRDESLANSRWSELFRINDASASGELPSYKIGGALRFDVEELRAWIAEHRAAERRRQVRGHAIRETVTPPAAGRRAGRSRHRPRTPEQPKRSSDGKGERAADDSDQAQRNFLDRAGITLVSPNPRRNAEQSYGSILGITGFGLCGRGPRLLRDTAD
jgi:hypothetical protein